MLDLTFTILLWIAAIGSGLVAGLFFAFSTFIMAALANIAPSHGISAMQSINSTILRSLFIPLFFGTTLASAALAIVALLRWGEPGAWSMLAAAVIYVLGMFVGTIAFNVPLNTALARVEASSNEAVPVWSRYLAVWTRWNHVRTIAATIACGLYIVAIVAQGHSV